MVSLSATKMENEPQLTSDAIWNAMNTIMDPEIPVISLMDMGIIRAVELNANNVTVTMTPTFSGCPALLEMEILIREKVQALGAKTVVVERQMNPPWTSDWITPQGRAKLKAFGLAPPHQHNGNVIATFFDLVPCPRCDSKNTSLQNSFGSTLCRAIWTCNDCLEPFEQFKPL
ncbi:MAG: ring-1,2-phenylacetyl-CoA epoxidase subunit PaaD [Cellvibrionaceae bacterium]|jgi:ring-1,2-phenylacetyl-CoA epoxidase subunit PaaD